METIKELAAELADQMADDGYTMGGDHIIAMDLLDTLASAGLTLERNKDHNPASDAYMLESMHGFSKED
jgi:hypothetical protein